MVIKFSDKLTSYQQEVYDYLGGERGTGKVAVIKSVRQSGKTFFCQMLLSVMALQHPGTTSVLIEPTLDQARNVFKSVVKGFRDSRLITQANASLLTITFSNGSELLFRSTQQEDANRGYTVSGVLILDEAAYLKDEAIYTILPLCNVHNAPIIVASTPFMMEGYFFDMVKMCERSDSDKMRYFDWSSHAEISRFLTPERKEFYRLTMSRNKYTTEVLGEFLSADGLLFTNLEHCLLEATPEASTLYMGIDFATGSGGDYTVLSIFNERGEQVAMHRTNNLSPMAQVDWLAGIINDYNARYKIHRIYAEENGIGKVYVDALRSKVKPRILAWVTTNDSKQDLVTTFQIALENERVKIIRDTTLLDELRRFEAVVNPTTKKIRYGGHVGTHDDCVMATLLGYYAYEKSTTSKYSITTL